MAQGYSIFIGLVIVVAMGAGAWFLSPKGETQMYVRPQLMQNTQKSHIRSLASQCGTANVGDSIWRSSLLLALACCYLMWAITFLAQLHPLIEPKRSNLRESAVHH
ncbi:ATP synthase subunit h [Colletotrichum incanum]|nr:ATP synthase subunit h [Colletotrichum incanum]